MTSLYQLTDNVQAIMQKIVNGELDAETAKDTLEGLHLLRDEKYQNIYRMIRRMNGLLLDISEQKKALNAQEKHYKSVMKQLNYLLVDDMQRTDTYEKLVDNQPIKLKHSNKVKITDEKKLPAYLCTQQVVYKPDKKAIKERLNRGERISGAMIDDSPYIAIKGVKRYE